MSMFTDTDLPDAVKLDIMLRWLGTYQANIQFTPHRLPGMVVSVCTTRVVRGDKKYEIEQPLNPEVPIAGQLLAAWGRLIEEVGT